MSYNKYNTRNSGRYNTPGRFVSAGELSGGRPDNYNNGNMGPPRPFPPVQYNDSEEQSQNYNTPNPEPSQPPTEMFQQDVEMKPDMMDTTAEDSASRPPWMKSKLQGVRKIPNKERRRRQNETLRRLLTPKNALMVLNEIAPGEQLANQFKVEPVSGGCQFYRPDAHNFCADLTLHGHNYKGYGDNKLSARNAAAEQAIRDLMLQRMARFLAEKQAGGDGEEVQEGEGEETDETLPMIQLASYALHKLFSEWECEGHKVPQLRPTGTSISETASETGSVVGGGAGGAGGGRAGGGAKCKPKVLPENAASMHPCTLLTYMRPQLEYRELAASGAPPHNTLFTMAIDVDGNTYVGQASNKREARKAAAKAACETIFDVKFEI